MAIERTHLDEYCLSHSTLPSALCAELERFTLDEVDHSTMLSGPLVASVLGFLMRSIGAKKVLEVGCYTGYSALAMAENLPPDGELVTLDVDPDTQAIARRFWDRSPRGKQIRGILGPGLETLRTLAGPFDFVFIDADKPNYLNYLEAVLPKLAPNAIVVADNCLWSGRVADPKDQDERTNAIRRFNDAVHGHPGLESVLIPVRDGLHVIRKLDRKH